MAASVAATIAAPAALLLGSAGPAAAQNHAARADASAGGGLSPDPPLRRPKPATITPNLAAPVNSPWKRLTNDPPFSPGTMLVASDGTVLVHSEPESGGTANWYKLTPDSTGSYVDGTWSKIPSMPGGYDPLYFASAILPDGRMIVEGGEYLGGKAVWTNKGAIYDPVTNKWQKVAPPSGWTNIGDAQSDVLADGTFMLAQACQDCTSPNFINTTDDALFNANTLSWTVIAGLGKNDFNDEEGWTLEPSGQLLTVDTWLPPAAELYTPSSQHWSSAGNTPKTLVNVPAAEIGPQVEMPGGNTFVVSAGNGAENPDPCTTSTRAPTALYRYSTHTWVNGPSIPTTGGMQMDSADGPGSVLPDGNVLFDVSPCVYNTPIAFYQYNAATNTLSSVPNVPDGANDSTFYTRMVNLPNGQILFNDGSNDMEVYTAGGTPNATWAPKITSVGSSFTPGQTATLSGTQLAGLDQGSAYGDDVQDNTNFPLVRITNTASGVVTYARTSQWSSVSVAPGASSATGFTVPTSTPAGASTLQVIANGIASQPVPVTIN